MHERLRDTLLEHWARLVTTRPRLVLTICLLLAVGSVVLTTQELEFRSDRSELIDPNLEWNRRYAEYRAAFPHWDDLVVVLDAPRGDRAVDALTETLAETLALLPEVRNATGGIAPLETEPALFALLPPEAFDRRLAELSRLRAIAAQPDAIAALIVAMQRSRENAPDESDGSAAAAPLLQPYLDAARGNPVSFANLVPDDWIPLRDPEGAGRLRFIFVSLAAVEAGGIDTVDAGLTAVRKCLSDQLTGRAGLTWGVTGIPAIESDETRQSIADSTLASIVAFVLITVLMLVVFRGVLVPLIAAASLVIGISWSFGWLVLVVGHLQLLSVVFTVILLGLGVDFALHLLSRLELVVADEPDLETAMVHVFRHVGPGLLTGAITTAAAFGSTAITDFRGMAEMGIISAGGILLCLLAVLFVLPAALALSGRWKTAIRARAGGPRARFAHGWLDHVDFHPRIAFAAALVLIAGLALPGLGVTYDPNVLNLHPPEIESVVWERRVVTENARSAWAGLVLCSPDEAPGLADRLRELDEVAAVSGMGLLTPTDRLDRARRIAAAFHAPQPSPPGGTDQDAARLTALLTAIAPSLSAELRTECLDAAAALRAVSSDEANERCASLDAPWSDARPGLARLAERALTPRPLTAEDLPPVLRDRWTSGDAWLLLVEPAADPDGRSILHPDRLGPFVDAVRTIAPEVLGPPVQIYESTRLIIREYLRAAGLALAAILILLLLDFRSLADTLCAMVPVTAGFLGMFGVMSLAGVPLNFANIIVMPLIFGIGVDSGVHIVHRWRLEPWGRPAGLSGGTGRGVTLTLMTTIVGFGCMILAEHRGIRSLGQAMVAGLAVTQVACWLLLPPLLRLRTRIR